VRQLEKYEQTLISCSCERENAWLDESLYAVDTSLVPRGGHRRRKSMEPRALANHNGTLVPSATPAKNMSPTKEFLNLDTPQSVDRRQSTQWVRSPATESPEVNYEDVGFVTPKTEYPDRFTSYEDEEEEEGGETPYFLKKDGLVQMTCPVGQKTKNFDLDVAAEDEDELAADEENGNDTSVLPPVAKAKDDGGFMQRLLMARRKSLQFAPKRPSRLNPDYGL
jgi:hypothetical protein